MIKIQRVFEKLYFLVAKCSFDEQMEKFHQYQLKFAKIYISQQLDNTPQKLFTRYNSQLSQMLKLHLNYKSLYFMNIFTANQKNNNHQKKRVSKPYTNNQNESYNISAKVTSIANKPPFLPSPRTPLNAMKDLTSSNNNFKSTQQVKFTKNDASPITKINFLNHLQKKQIVGKGGFGKVWRVQVKGGGKSFALKQMSKALVITKKSVPSVMNQKCLLTDLENFFLVNLLYSYQDRQSLFLLLDYLPGGDLRYHLCQKKFNQEEAKILIVCILLGLKYLHDKGIIHRDIKPQNIVLDKNGYAHITDLGVARPFRLNNSNDTSGTPGYMAPQVLCRQDHSYSVDYFAVGIIAHELMLRKRPFRGRSRKQIRQQVLARQPQIRKQEIPDDWSLESADFINRLIQRKPHLRLGNPGIDQIFKHPWLRSFPVQKIANRSIQVPWVPKSANGNDQDFQSSEQGQLKDLISQNELMLRNREVQQLFEGYEYTRPSFRLF